MKKGNWIVFDHNGKTLRKRLTGAHISVVRHDTHAVAETKTQLQKVESQTAILTPRAPTPPKRSC